MIRFASINIEGDLHRDAVVSFLRDFRPDVVCFQELTEQGVKFFEDTLGMEGNFLPLMQSHAMPGNIQSPAMNLGLGFYSSLPISNLRKEYYYQPSKELPKLIIGDEETVWRGIIEATVEKDGESYTIATTHFTRTADGSTSDKQREDLKNLFKLLMRNSELILCGDFNAPRGGEIFGALSKIYTDNIPSEYNSSLDSKLHKAGHLKFMVDGLFTTHQYSVTEAKLTEGISDHKAVTAIIEKTA